MGKTFKVYTFSHQGKTKMRYTAYTQWANEAWAGCKVYEVEATNGTEAKRKAIEMRRTEESKGEVQR